MTTDRIPALSPATVQELRTLADALHDVRTAAATAEWGDDSALMAEAGKAQSELAWLPNTVGTDIAAAAASPQWQARADEYLRAVATTRDLEPTPEQAAANVVVAVKLARLAVAEAVAQVTQAGRVAAEPAGASVIRGIGPLLRDLGRRVTDELRHVMFDRPRVILLRIAITLGIGLAAVAFYHLTGLTRYDAGRLTLYLFSAVVGSVVCTNALCFEAARVRRALAAGDPVWRILVAKNLAMATLVIGAGLPVIAVLTAAGDGNPVAMIDQLVTMVFIWLGVANVLSVVSPLRNEPVAARWHDGTWKPYLLSFAVSYGVGLTVNLMIYWRLWSRQTASAELVGGDWAAFALVLASALTSWVLLTVFAVACSRDARLRGLISREMVVYQKN